MKTVLFISLFLLAGCTHSIHMVHTDGLDSNSAISNKARYVEASTSQNVVLFFAFDTDYVDQAKRDLELQCPGKVSAVSTQYSTSHGFLHWTNKILMKGLCS